MHTVLRMRTLASASMSTHACGCASVMSPVEVSRQVYVLARHGACVCVHAPSNSRSRRADEHARADAQAEAHPHEYAYALSLIHI
eukprot:12493843-Alexandrium_andersonii.AAC.1